MNVIKNAMRLSAVGVGALLATIAYAGCVSAPAELDFEETTTCDEQSRYKPAPTCFHPDGCCELGEHGMAAICAEYYRDRPMPIMCSSKSPGESCEQATTEQFRCGTEPAILWCCPAVN